LSNKSFNDTVVEALVYYLCGKGPFNLLFVIASLFELATGTKSVFSLWYKRFSTIQ